MGIQRTDGYSASVEAYLVVGGERLAVAKTSHDCVFLAEPCALPPGSEATLVVIVDGEQFTRSIVLTDGTVEGRRQVMYAEAAPF